MDKKNTSIADVCEFPLQIHNDQRGWLCETFREEWDVPHRPIQWNTLFSKQNTLRGVRTHLNHYDYIMVPHGKMLLGLKDLRIRSATYGVSDIVTLSPQNPSAWLIPPGVAHGFFFPEDSITFYSLSDYWNPEMDFGCQWNDPDLNLDWPISDPIISEHDKNAKTLQEVRQILQKIRPQEF